MVHVYLTTGTHLRPVWPHSRCFSVFGGEHPLPQLQTQKARTELPTPFQSHSIQQNSGHLGVALSLPDLDVLTEVLKTPVLFLHYARRRIQVERSPFTLHGDEMDLLGLYLAGHLSIDSPKFEGYNGVMVAGLSGDVDEYIWKKHGRGLDVDPPQPPMSPEFGQLIRDVLATRCLGATDCATTLLDVSGNSRKQLLDGIAEAKDRVRRNGKMQRFSAIIAGGELGVSFLAMDSSKDPGNLARQLQCYAVVQKYAERCSTWVALAADVASSRAVDLCIFLTGPWEEDAELE